MTETDRPAEEEGVPWCNACQSYHHPDNPTCVLKLTEPLQDIEQLLCYRVAYKLWSQPTWREDIRDNVPLLLMADDGGIMLAMSFEDAHDELRRYVGRDFTPPGEPHVLKVNTVEIERIEFIGSVVELSRTAYRRLKATDWEETDGEES